MNWNVIIQVLDVMAFLLVTPEIIEEERLENFRRVLKNNRHTSVLIVALALYIPMSFYIERYLAVLNTYTINVVPSEGYFYTHITTVNTVLVNVCGIFLCVISSLFIQHLAAPLLVGLTDGFAVRGRLFVTGAGCFLLGRGISIWLAMHH